MRETWFATLMFFTPSLALDLIRGAKAEPATILPLLAIAAFTPSVWWWVVARHRSAGPGRGAMAGVVVATLVVLVQLGLFPQVLERAHPGANRDLFTMLMVLGLLWVLSVPFGAAIGALTAALGRVWRRATP